MQPRTRSFDELLASSPLLRGDAEPIRRMFHVEHQQRALEALAAELASAARDNADAADTWRRIEAFKNTILSLLRTGLSIP